MQMEEEEVESRDRSSSRRWTPTSEQIKMLKEIYYDAGIRCPTVDQIGRIAARLRRFGRVEGKNVFYWFQNHKAREKHKNKKNIINNNNNNNSNECSMCCYPTSQSFFFQGTSSVVNPNYNIPESYTRNIYYHDDGTSGGRKTLPLFPMHNADDERKVAMTPEESATATTGNANATLELSLSPTTELN